jgi:hypothetical protein
MTTPPETTTIQEGVRKRGARTTSGPKLINSAKLNLPSIGTLVGVSATLKLNAFPACRVLQIAATIIH